MATKFLIFTFNIYPEFQNEFNVNPKKLSIRLRLLSNDISDYFRGACFGVPAMDPDVLRLWTEYNKLLSELQLYYPDLFLDFHEISYPAPYLADEESFYKEGTMIFKPEHFAPLRLATEKLCHDIAPLIWGKESA